MASLRLSRAAEPCPGCWAAPRRPGDRDSEPKGTVTAGGPPGTRRDSSPESDSDRLSESTHLPSETLSRRGSCPAGTRNNGSTPREKRKDESTFPGIPEPVRVNAVRLSRPGARRRSAAAGRRAVARLLLPGGSGLGQTEPLSALAYPWCRA